MLGPKQHGIVPESREPVWELGSCRRRTLFPRVSARFPTALSAATRWCDINRVEMSAITQLVAGVPVSDLDASIDWYTRFFGRPPDLRVGDEVLWDIDEHATLFIEPNTAQAGAGRITFAVDGLDGLLEHLAAAAHRARTESRRTRTASAT